ncbi:hypothetical protein [Rhodococcus olei]|uniref:hypothetical protein n=1 Tax=Rhodococcus olei TaxID=2161675 RepID=UPI0031E92863
MDRDLGSAAGFTECGELGQHPQTCDVRPRYRIDPPIESDSIQLDLAARGQCPHGPRDPLTVGPPTEPETVIGDEIAGDGGTSRVLGVEPDHHGQRLAVHRSRAATGGDGGSSHQLSMTGEPSTISIRISALHSVRGSLRVDGGVQRGRTLPIVRVPEPTVR